jgi:hypothetical protein
MLSSASTLTYLHSPTDAFYKMGALRGLTANFVIVSLTEQGRNFAEAGKICPPDDLALRQQEHFNNRFVNWRCADDSLAKQESQH